MKNKQQRNNNLSPESKFKASGMKRRPDPTGGAVALQGP